MTEQNASIDGRTRRALDIAIAKRQVSQESYHAVLVGEITLQEAKAMGRDGAPAIDTGWASGGPGTATETSRSASAGSIQGDVGNTQKLCLCGCGEPVSRTFRPGHDSKLHSELAAQIRKGDILLRSERISDQQREFAVRHGLIGKKALPPQSREENPDA